MFPKQLLIFVTFFKKESLHILAVFKYYISVMSFVFIFL